MPAHNESFPWMSYYGNYDFFEGCMHKHTRVASVARIGEGLYDIQLIDNRTIRTFICECYSFGIAEFHESFERLGNLNAVVINSNWCGYSFDLKLYGRERNVGVFDIKGFMAALNFERYWEYLTDDERERLNQE